MNREFAVNVVQSRNTFEDSKGEQSIDNTVESSEPITKNHTSDANQDFGFSTNEVTISFSVLSQDFHTLLSVVCSITLVEPSCTNDYVMTWPLCQDVVFPHLV